MSRYIDADALKKAFVKPMNDFVDGVSRSLDIGKIIDAQPTADVVIREKYDELNDRYHRLLESANILADAVRDYERREDAEIH